MKITSVMFLLSAATMAGCTYNVSPYGASVQNVESIKSINIKSVSVTTFQSSKPGLANLTCRAAGPITVSPSFEYYIEKAFIDELKLAGAYDPKSTVSIMGRLEEIDFSSGITDGNWQFTLVISNARSESFTAKSAFGFSGSFAADKACQETAQAFAPAVQKLVHDVVRDPKFKQIVN